MNLNPTKVYDSYWRFAYDRQVAYFNKLAGKTPYCDNEIINSYRFTNCYRAADRTSQYLIKEVIYKGSQYSLDVVFRILLFKSFNKIETWKSICKEFGTPDWERFNIKDYDKFLKSLKGPIFNGAYIVPTGVPNFSSFYKHKNHLSLIDYLMKDRLYVKIENTKTLEEVYNSFKNSPMFGPFLAMQYTIDINYSNVTNFSEMDFISAGLGAKRGIEKCFSNAKDFDYASIIRWVCKMQKQEFYERGLKFQNLFGRDLQLIDCQNLFCEIDKYARVAHPDIWSNKQKKQKRIKQKFKDSLKPMESPWFPPKWSLNK